VRHASELIRATPGVKHAVAFAGFSGATRANSPNAGAIFVVQNPFEERKDGPTAEDLRHTLQERLNTVTEADMFVIAPPPVHGLGTAGGFKALTQDRGGRGLHALQEATNSFVDAAKQEHVLTSVFSPFRSSTPQIFADVDRVKANKLDVPVGNVFDTLQGLPRLGLRLPLAIIMIAPMCLPFALAGIDNNLITQIGFVVLIGLAAKNAVLIVEFAKQQEDQEDEGMDRFQAAVEAARLRLRPILMTALAFILGVVPRAPSAPAPRCAARSAPRCSAACSA